MTARRPCAGVILAGGTATRMGGEPKGLIRIGEARIIDRIAGAMRRSCDRLILSANDERAASWLADATVVRDSRGGAGALAGIEAALAAAGADAVCVAWDMPFVPAGLLEELRARGERGGAGIVAPKSGSPWGFEPLCAWYSAAIIDVVRAQLDAGDGRIGALAGPANVVAVDVSSWGDPAELFMNVNTPDDRARAQTIAARMKG